MNLKQQLLTMLCMYLRKQATLSLHYRVIKHGQKFSPSAYRDKMDRQLPYLKTVAGWKGFPTSGCDFRKRNIYCGFKMLEKSS